MPEIIKPNFEMPCDELERAFPDGSAFLGITAVHGLEPMIMVAGIGNKVNERLVDAGLPPKPIIIPHLYPDKEKQIGVLKDEFPDYQFQIYLSDELARILKQTEFTPAGYQDHLNRVVDFQPEVQRQLADFLAKPFVVSSLDGQTFRIIEPGQKLIEINTGANVAREGSHFIFPIKLSDLVKFISNNPDLRDTYDPDVLNRVFKMAQEMEDKYASAQIPDHHTLMTDGIKPKGVIYIPHIKDPKDAPNELNTSNEKGGIYVNVSGGGMGEKAAQIQARTLHNQGYAVLAPSWMNLDYAVPAGPQALYLKDENGNPFIKAVIIRPGYGSIWNAIEAEVSIGYLPSDVYEAPEMRGNERAITASGFGRVFSPRRDIMDLLSGGPGAIRDYKIGMYKRLKLPYGTSGLSIAADNIIRAEVGKK